MKTIIKIEKEDIITSRMGCNVEVQIDEKTSLIFTPEALDELSKDYLEIKEELREQKEAQNFDFSKLLEKDTNQLEIEFPTEIES